MRSSLIWRSLLFGAVLFGSHVFFVYGAKAGYCESAGELERNTATWYDSCTKPEPKVLERVLYVPTFVRPISPAIEPEILAVNASDCRKEAVPNDPDADKRFRRCMANWALEDVAMKKCWHSFDKQRMAYTQTREASPRQIEQCILETKIKLIKELIPDLAETCAQFHNVEDNIRCIDIFYVKGPRPGKDYAALIRGDVNYDRDAYPDLDIPHVYGDQPRAPPKNTKLVSDPLQSGGCGGKSCQSLGAFGPDTTGQEAGPPPKDDAAANGSSPAAPTSGSGQSRPFQRSSPRPAAGSRVRLTTTAFRPAPRTRQSTITSKDFHQGISSYDRQQGAITAGDGRKLSIQPMMAALQKVAPQAAQTPFVTTSNGSLQPSPQLQRAIVNNYAELRRVGGVALDVTFQNLTALGVSDLRADGSKTLIENPVLISLRKLLDAVKPYAASADTWRSLPESLRYPGNIARVRGFVLDPATEDVFLVGTSADRPETRLDIDLLTVLLDVSWHKGVTPGVSLDPSPPTTRPPDLPVAMARSAGTGRPITVSFNDRDAPKQVFVGPQMARLINLPNDTLASRILLDADYEMKRINFGLVKIDDPDFKSQLDLLKVTANRPARSRSRFWFHPIPLTSNSVRVSYNGNVVLFDAGMQVLTESLSNVGEGLGEADALSQQAADNFTRAFSRIEHSPAVRPIGIFSVLKGTNDIVTLGSILRKAAVNYAVLDQFRTLPFRHLTGAEAVPTSYPGQSNDYVDENGTGWTLFGGVDLHSRQTRRSYDQFDDEVNGTLERAAASSSGQGFVFPVPITFTLTAQNASGSAAAELSRLAGLKLFAAGNDAAASEKFKEAVQSDPLDIETWTLLALAQSAAKPSDARVSIQQALAIDAHDSFAQKVALKMALRSNENVGLDSFDESVRRDAAKDYINAAYAKINGRNDKKDFDSAFADAQQSIRLWPSLNFGYYVRCLVHYRRDEHDLAVQDCTTFLQQFGSSLAPHLVRGLSYQSKGDLQAAARDFDEAVSIDPRNTDALYDRGVNFTRQRDYDRAIADFKRIIEIDPQNGAAYSGLSGAYVFQNKYGLAIEAESQALRLRPSDAVTILTLRGLIFDMAGDAASANRDFDQAIKLNPNRSTSFANRGLHRWNHEQDRTLALQDFDRAIELDPLDAHTLDMRAVALQNLGRDELALRDFVEVARLTPADELAWIGQGDIYRKRRDFAHAIELYKTAAEVAPKSARPISRLGLAYKEMGRADLALNEYNRAVKLDPGFAESFNNRGGLFGEQGDDVHAFADFNEAVRLDPTIAEAFANRARIFRLRKDYEHAIADYSEAIRLRPTLADAFIGRGNISVDMGNLDRALDDFTSAIRIDPKNALAFYNRSVMYRAKGDASRALSDLNESLLIDPRSTYALVDRGKAFLRSGEPDKASADFSRAILIDPRSSVAYLNRAIADGMKNDNRSAISDLDAAIKIDPRSAPAYFFRGYAFQQTKDFVHAIADLTQSISLNPNGVDAYRTRSTVYEAMGRHDLAVADLEVVRRLNPGMAPPSGPSPPTSPSPPAPATNGAPLLTADQAKAFIAAYNEIQALPYEPEMTKRDAVLKKYGFSSYIDYLNIQRKVLAAMKDRK